MRLGAWGANLSTADLTAFVEGCLELGLQDFDHADIYGDYRTEGQFGQVLAQHPNLRERLRITTKCGIRMVSEQRSHSVKHYDSSREHILASVDNSLQQLRTDYIDLLLLHRPDLLMETAEIAAAFEALQAAGKVRHFGVSNFTPPQLQRLQDAFPLVNHQVEISALHLNAFTDGTLDQCQQLGIVPSAWSPLGGGRLFTNDADERSTRVRDCAGVIGEKLDAGVDHVLLAWLLRHPAGIVPVLGTSKLQRVAAAVEATRLKLSREDWYRLWTASTGTRVP